MEQSSMDREYDEQLLKVGIAITEAKLRTGYEDLTCNELVQDLGSRLSSFRHKYWDDENADRQFLEEMAWAEAVLNEFYPELEEAGVVEEITNLAWQWANHSAHSDVDGLLEGLNAN